jgi:hypothetical protein
MNKLTVLLLKILNFNKLKLTIIKFIIVYIKFMLIILTFIQLLTNLLFNKHQDYHHSFIFFSLIFYEL